MLDRQDIDALLVGALYDELSSADEARLATHFEAHPADRSALDDLKTARQTVREKVATSRIFELQLDPPQAVSALLLQEAARRAPRKQVVRDDAGETWFQRFVRTFVAHPAMAAAATLVLVVGVAGSIYLRHGDAQFAEQQVAQRETAAQGMGAAAPPEAAWGSAALGVAGPTGGEGAAGKADTAADTGKDRAGDLRENSVEVALEDGDGKRGESRDQVGGNAQLDRNAKNAAVGDNERADGSRHRTNQGTDQSTKDKAPAHVGGDQLAFSGGKAPASPAKPAAKGYVEVPQTQHMPKELDEDKPAARPDDVATTTTGAVVGAPGASRGAASGGGVGGGFATAPPASNRPSTPAPRAPAPRAEPPAEPAPPPPPRTKASDATVVWARGQHARIAALVKTGKCGEAAPIAVAIKNRAPDYYNAYVATDRALKPCMQYVNEAAERESEKASRAKRVDTK